MHGLRIIGLAVLASIGYGIFHDQITARICVEYFTIGHPPLFPTTSPTLLALGWGVVATWWVGLPLGLVLAAAARLGARHKLTAVQLRRPILVLLLAMGAAAGISGAIGGLLAAAGKVWVAPALAEVLPWDRQVGFLIDLWMHSASYAVGIIGGLALAAWTVRRRLVLAAALPSGCSS